MERRFVTGLVDALRHLRFSSRSSETLCSGRVCFSGQVVPLTASEISCTAPVCVWGHLNVFVLLYLDIYLNEIDGKKKSGSCCDKYLISVRAKNSQQSKGHSIQKHKRHQIFITSVASVNGLSGSGNTKTSQWAPCRLRAVFQLCPCCIWEILTTFTEMHGLIFTIKLSLFNGDLCNSRSFVGKKCEEQVYKLVKLMHAWYSFQRKAM